MFSYDPISPDAKRLTGAGLTVLFDQEAAGRQAGQGAGHRRAGPGPADARQGKRPGPKGLAGLSGVDADASLYEIDPKAEQGKVYIRAFCPGATRLWLSFSGIATRRDLRVQAFGDDPKGRARPGSAARWTSRGAASGSCPRAPARSDGRLDRQPDRRPLGQILPVARPALR
jgi:hypothetical protein